jgi:N6-adenosine-specific RNA methylase IME4
MGGSNLAIVGIWITNSAQSREAVRSAFAATHLELFEEWIWVKCTTAGEPVMPVDGLWRKPYEVIQWGRRRSAEDEGQVRRRVIFAVPDIHSRKPSLKELTETIFFPPERSERIPAYSALEVFARHLTTEWWACGDEVLKFNDAEWWADMGS